MWTIQVLFLVCGLWHAVYSELDDACTLNENCNTVSDNSYCQQMYSSGDVCNTGKACKCLRGFIAKAGDCVTAQYVGTTCTASADDHCVNTVANTECTNSECVCPSSYTSLSRYLCVASTFKKIGETCTDGDTCYYEYEAMLKIDGVCTDSSCVCPANTKAFGITCRPIKIDDACKTGSTECPLKATCTGDACSCDSTHTASADKTACNYDDAPLSAGSECIVGDRYCTHPLTCVECATAASETTKCSQKTGLLGGDCAVDSDCNINVATCTGGKCACSAAYTAYGTSACLPSGATGSVCWSNAECTGTLTDACLNNLCAVCPVGNTVRAATGAGCVPALNGVCTATADCTGTVNTFCYQEYASGDTCVTGKTCKCKKGFVERLGECVAVQYVGDSCASNDYCSDTVTNTACTSGTCSCPETHTSISKYMCVSSTYKKIGEACAGGDTCYYELDARLKTDAVCAGDVCVCPVNTKAFGISCKPIKIGESCTTGSTECPLKASCTSNTCSCDDTHPANSYNTACDITSGALGADEVCAIGDRTCTSPLTCVACATSPATATTKCGKRPFLIGESCNDDSDCSINVAVCSTTCACPTGYDAYGTTMCLPSGTTGSVCWSNAECTVTSTDACLNNVCASCPANTVRAATGAGCVPELNGVCTATADCTGTANTFCYQEYESADTCVTGKTCKCKKGFVEKSGSCVTAQYVGDSCASNDYCSDTVTNAVCTSDMCTCPDTHTSISKFMCVESTYKKIGEACPGGDTCYYELDARLKIDAVCTSDVCVCPEHTKAFGISCRPIKIDDACITDSAECPLKASCTSATCSCDGTHAPNTAKTACDITSGAGAANAVCVIGERTCTDPLTCVACATSPNAATTKCGKRPTLLTESCTEDSDCSINVAVCTGSSCECPNGYMAFGTTTCLPSGATGSVCWSNAGCTGTVTDACLNNVCGACPATTARAATGAGCVPALNGVCTATADCTGTENTFCYQEYASGDTCVIGKTCKCKKGFVEKSGSCVTAQYVGDSCASNEYCSDTVTNAVCTSDTCTCPDTHTSISKYVCVESTYKKIGETCTSGDTCYYELDARLKTDAVCTSNVCVCPEHTKAFGISCRPIKIDDACITDSAECPMKASCTSATCSCDGTHAPITAKTACDITSEAGAANAVCVIGERTCTDPLTCVACATSPNAATTKCGKRPALLTESCTEDSDCSINVAVCTGSSCECPNGYMAFGTTTCLPSGATGSVCWSNAGCTGTVTDACLNNVCGACPATTARAATGAGCVPALHGVCMATADCTGTENTFCYQEYASGDTCVIGKTCKCKKGFVEKSGSCVTAQYVGDSCASNDYCSDTVTNAVCTSDTCTCPDTHTSISKYVCVESTYKKIGETCTSGDTCYYELDARLKTDAVCTSNVCVCPEHTKAFGISCRPIKIDDACITDSAECPLKASCTSATCSCDGTHAPITAKTACDITSGAGAANAVCVIGERTCTHPLTCVACATSPNEATTKCGKRPGLLDESCNEDSDCSINVAVCSTTCECPTQYLAYGTTMCLPSGATGSACWSNAECTDIATDACLDNVCASCPANTVRATAGAGCDPELDGPCTATSECTIAKTNSFCEKLYSSGDTCATAGKCKCRKGYLAIEGVCVAAQYIGDGCADFDYCANTVEGTVCTSGTCVCPTSTRTPISKYNCVLTAASKRIGETCIADDTCYHEYEAGLMTTPCADAGGTCACPVNTKQFGTTCRPVKIADACTVSSSECPLNAVCATSPCACDASHAASTDNTTCVLSTDPVAAAGTCVVANQNCEAGLTCVDCTGTAPVCGQETGLIGDTCEIESDCSNKVTVCTGSPLKCECAPGYMAHGKHVCMPSGALNSVCIVDGDCTATGTACTGFLCACNDTHVLDGTTCITACTTDNAATECPAAENKECDTATRKCRCKPPAVPLGSTTPLTCTAGTMNSNCIDDNHCPNLANAACSGGKCGCADGFQAANNKCEKSGAGIKAAWMPIVIVSGLIPALYMMLF